MIVVGSDVVYAVIVDLDSQAPGLRWAMSAQLDILYPGRATRMSQRPNEDQRTAAAIG